MTVQGRHRKESPQKQSSEQKRKKTLTEVKNLSELPKANNHIPMDSDEDEEEPQNELGTSSNSRSTVPVLPHHQGRAASSHGPFAFKNSADEDSEQSDEYSARCQDFGRTVFSPDLHVLTDDEHWTVTLETQVWSRSQIILFCDFRKQRTTGCVKLDHYAMCAAVFVPR